MAACKLIPINEMPAPKPAREKGAMDALAGWKPWVGLEAEDCNGSDKLEEDWAYALNVAPKASRETATNRRIKETSLKLVAQIHHAEIVHRRYGQYKQNLRKVHIAVTGVGMAALGSGSLEAA